jgi:hypothetical protein
MLLYYPAEPGRSASEHFAAIALQYEEKQMNRLIRFWM